MLDFERASALHKKVEKVSSILRGLPELPRKLSELHAVIVQPAAAKQSVALFVVRGGRIAGPAFLHFAEMQSQPRSIEEILREMLGSTDAAGAAQGDGPTSREQADSLSDHLSLIARWYYGKPRIGEIFFPQPARGVSGKSEWPVRRISRACSRILSPQPPADDAASPA
jgi:hypothetical protein